MPDSPLEIQEGVDLMRIIDNGLPIEVLKTDHQTIGVDIPEDISRVEKELAKDSVYTRYREAEGTA
jgi:3-deoxy-manno-octulosonate cytidylyltransferase (CMP-KDO synthetase)